MVSVYTNQVLLGTSDASSEYSAITTTCPRVLALWESSISDRGHGMGIFVKRERSLGVINRLLGKSQR